MLCRHVLRARWLSGRPPPLCFPPPSPLSLAPLHPSVYCRSCTSSAAVAAAAPPPPPLAPAEPHIPSPRTSSESRPLPQLEPAVKPLLGLGGGVRGACPPVLLSTFIRKQLLLISILLLRFLFSGCSRVFSPPPSKFSVVLLEFSFGSGKTKSQTTKHFYHPTTILSHSFR